MKKKSLPEFLKYLSSLSMPLFAAAGAIAVPAATTAAPAQAAQSSLKMSPEAISKLAIIADQVVKSDAKEQDVHMKSQLSTFWPESVRPWPRPQIPPIIRLQYAMAGTDVEHDSASFVDLLDQVKREG